MFVSIKYDFFILTWLCLDEILTPSGQNERNRLTDRTLSQETLTGQK